MERFGQVSDNYVSVGTGRNHNSCRYDFCANWFVISRENAVLGGRNLPLKDNNLPEQASDNPTAQLGSTIGDIVAKSNVKK